MDQSKQVIREDLSKHYAAAIAQYQEDHRDLMAALYDNNVTVEAFERLSLKIQNDVNELKRIRVELHRQRQIIESGK